MIFKVTIIGRPEVFYVKADNLEQAKQNYLSGLFGCLNPDDVIWTEIKKLPPGEAIMGTVVTR